MDRNFQPLYMVEVLSVPRGKAPIFDRTGILGMGLSTTMPLKSNSRSCSCTSNGELGKTGEQAIGKISMKSKCHLAVFNCRKGSRVNFKNSSKFIPSET